MNNLVCCIIDQFKASNICDIKISVFLTIFEFRGFTKGCQGVKNVSFPENFVNVLSE